MGDPKRLRKKYEGPSHPWQKKRIDEENKLIKEYGLKNKKEIWRAKTQLKKYRQLARELVALTAEERKEKEDILIGKLERMGILPKGSTIDNILSLKVEDLLERRLQTRVWKIGIAKTSKQSRQLITHGHISINGRKTTAPGLIISVEGEKTIEWYGEPVVIITEVPEAEKGLEVIAEKVKPSKAEKITAKEAVDEELEKEAAEAVKGEE